MIEQDRLDFHSDKIGITIDEIVQILRRKNNIAPDPDVIPYIVLHVNEYNG